MINQLKSQLTSRIIKQHVETNRKILEILNFSSFLFFFLRNCEKFTTQTGFIVFK